MHPTAANNTRYFVNIISTIRPKRSDDDASAKQGLLSFINGLEEYPQQLQEFQQQCRELLVSSDVQQLFADGNDVFGSENLLEQLLKDVKYSILPPLVKEDAMSNKIRQIFSHKKDYRWVLAVPDEYWCRLLLLSGIDNSFVKQQLQQQILNATAILSYKMAALGLDDEFTKRFMVEGELMSPFLEQNKEVGHYLELYEKTETDRHEAVHTNHHIIVLLNQCLSSIQTIRKKAPEHGTSLKQSYLLNKIESNISQMKILLDILDDDGFDLPRLVAYLKQVVYNENNRYSIRHTLSKNIGSLAYQIAEHKGVTGEHYITSQKEEFIHHFKAAFGGGFIITIMVFLKIGASSFPITDFWKAVCYSIIYASGFVVIHLLGGTVATKQPAMTASALARELDKGKNGKYNLQSIALLMSQVSRSQIIAVVGNLIAVFPATLLGALLLDMVFDFQVTDAGHAWQYLQEIHPLYSLSAWYGAIAGFYLFLSGIITGYFDNAVVYSNIPERIRRHPKWVKVLGERRLARLADYLEHNLGAVMGNIMIGIFLGTATFIGKVFGLPFDIRHVTISTGLFAVALETLSFAVGLKMLFGVLLGLFFIGLFNILSSFGFAFYVALKSRNIDTAQLWQLPLLLLKYFMKYPLDFFYPPKVRRTEESVFAEKP